MKEGKWLEPRHRDKDIFSKDYPNLDMSALEARCPGCKDTVTLSRKSAHNKIAGWCKNCCRAVTI